jgi:hypothetical protein
VQTLALPPFPATGTSGVHSETSALAHVSCGSSGLSLRVVLRTDTLRSLRS